MFSLPAFLPLFALFFPVSSPCFLSHSFLVFPFSVFYLVDLFTLLSLSPLFSLVLLFLPPNLIASFLFPSPLLSSALVTSSYSLFPLLSASICSFLLAYTNISFPFLLSSSLFQFPSSVSLLPLFFFFPCSFLISLNFFLLSSLPRLNPLSFAHLSCSYLVSFFISSSFSLSSSPCSLSNLSSPSLFPLFPVLPPSFPLLLASLSPPVSSLRCLLLWLTPSLLSCQIHFLPPSVLLLSAEKKKRRRRTDFSVPELRQQNSSVITASFFCLFAAQRQTDRQTHSSFSSLLCRLPTRTMHQKKKPDCPRWPIRTSKLRVVLDQEGSRTENTDVRLNRNLKIHLSVCKFWFLSFFLFPSLSPLLVLALKSSLSAWFFWGAALRFLSPRSSRKRFSSFWPVAISLADVSLRCFASHHFSLWARPSLPSSPPLSLCLLHPLSASQVSAGLNAWGASTRIVLVFRPRRRENLSFVRFVS